MQLLGRQWKIEVASETNESDYHIYDEVQGNGVIGLFPTLRKVRSPSSLISQHRDNINTDGMFTYQSVASIKRSRGRMSGSFIFVRGRINISIPAEEYIHATVNYFPLNLPRIIF